jgi:putative aldouronate transport system permease protein
MDNAARGRFEINMAKRKRASGEFIFQTSSYIVFAIFALLCLFPFYYIFTVSVSNNDLVRKGVLLMYPKGMHFSNYYNAFLLRGFGHSTLITLARTVIGTSLTVISSTWMGYSFSKKEFWKRSFWYKFVIITMYFNAGVIPVYLNFRNLRLTNTFWIYIIGFVVPFYIILCKTFIENMPSSLEESAKIDGAKYGSIFFYIILPLSKPIIATVCIFVAVGHWNSYLDTVLYITKPELYTLQYTLYLYLNAATALARAMSTAGAGMTGVDLSKVVSPPSLRMTVAMIVSLPILCVYPFFQRYFVKGIMIGAIKG